MLHCLPVGNYNSFVGILYLPLGNEIIPIQRKELYFIKPKNGITMPKNSTPETTQMPAIVIPKRQRTPIEMQTGPRLSGIRKYLAELGITGA